MPIYEYECRACGRRHEVVQAMSAPSLTTCASCQGEIYRVISAPGLSFKGQGWYITDYARKGQETDTTKKVAEKSDKKDGVAPVSTTPATGEKKAEPSKAPESKGALPPPAKE